MIEHDDRRCSTALAEVSTSKGDRDLPPRFRRFFKGFGAFDTRPTARICQTLPGAFCQSTPLAGELRGNCLARNALLVEVCGSSLGDALHIAGRGPDHDRDLTQPTRTCFAPIDDEAKRPLRHVAGRFLLRSAPLTHPNTCYTSSVILGLGVSPMRRRDFITIVGGAAAAWPLAARAQQTAMPVVGFVHAGSFSTSVEQMGGLRKGLAETGYVVGRNLAIEYRPAEGRYDRLPALVTDLLDQQVAVLVAGGGNAPAQAAKAATANIPIVFVTGSDPIRAGLVASLSRPGGNVTGVSMLASALMGKWLD